MQRVTIHRQYQLLQASAFLQKYHDLRIPQNLSSENPQDLRTQDSRYLQEVYYNMGRFFHHYCMLKYAQHFYEKALDIVEKISYVEKIDKEGEIEEASKDDVGLDLRLEIAHNLSLLYLQSGNLPLAHHIFQKYSYL